jgi:TRAP-type C4-dicarboxylate transport system substrate-binding protein
MKKLLVFLVFVLVVSLLIGVCSGCKSSSEGKTYKFTYNNFFPSTHGNSILAEMWIKEIQKRSNGAVNIQYLPGASLTAANKVYDGVLNGISDIGFSCVAYTPGIFPTTEIIDMPQGYPTGYVATMVANDYYSHFKPAEWDKVHLFYNYATGPQIVFTTKKPVKTLEDLKGLVLRSTGVGAKIATALGASGYAAAQNEALDLLSKGVIDGSIAPIEVLKSWSQADVVNYATECTAIGSVTNMYVVMNKDKWDSLTPDLQKIFTDVSKQFMEYHARLASAIDKQGKDYFNAQPGRQEIFLSDTEAARWVAAVSPLVDQSLADLKSKGYKADELEAYIKDRIKYWTGKQMSEADCLKWVTENVKKP